MTVIFYRANSYTRFISWKYATETNAATSTNATEVQSGIFFSISTSFQEPPNTKYDLTSRRQHYSFQSVAAMINKDMTITDYWAGPG
ncbi:MAG: hypothetical protein SCK70_07775 [bacterium]|nr:hypothetical protein [bacterium]